MTELKDMRANMAEEFPLAGLINRYVRENKCSINIMIRGKSQYRKSTIANKLAKALNGRWFNLKRQIAIIKASSMMRLFNEKLPYYRVRWFDEIGVAMNHKRWYSWFSLKLNEVAQTHGMNRSINIFTVPYSSLVDNDLRKLFDMEIEIVDKWENMRMVKAKILALQYNDDPDIQKVYKHRILGKFANGRIAPISEWYIEYPNEEELEEYFSLITPLKNELHNRSTIEARHQEKMTERSIEFNPNKAAEKVLLNKDKFIHRFHGENVIDVAMIMNDFHVGIRRAGQIKSAVNYMLNKPFNPNLPSPKRKELIIEL